MTFMRSLVIGGALLLASASGSLAQSWLPNGVYLRGDIGGASGTNTTFKDAAPTAGNCILCTSTAPGQTGSSGIYGVGVGYRFMPAFRADITADYMNDLKYSGRGNFAGVPGSGSARIRSFTTLLNGYLDIDGLVPNLLGPFQPYLDAGVGVSRNELGRISGVTAAGATGSISGHTTTNFAWGLGAGVAYPLTTSISLDLAYKYLDLGDLRSGATATAFGFTAPRTAQTADLHVHAVTLGIRFAFGAPPAAPPVPIVAAPPAPPPAVAAPTKEIFIVFFEFDRSSLTADGKRVVDAAAAAFKSGKSGVAIAGYTDLSGTAQYNLALSKRRAETVKTALVRDGVPASAIDESWHGKENPRVPTGDGVREPQNRRVEITM